MSGPESPIRLFDLSGKSALVTGATGAFGRVAPRALGAAGVNAVLAGANRDLL